MSELDFLPMCAFFFIIMATIPSYFMLPSKEKECSVPDVLTPLHFRFMYVSLMVLACLIVGNALRELREEGEKSTISKESSPNYFMAILILIAWWGPFVAQPFLPQKTDYNPVIDSDRSRETELLTEGGDDYNGAEQEMLLHSSDHDNTIESSNRSLNALQEQSNSEENMSGDNAMEPISTPTDVESSSEEEVDQFVEEEDGEVIGQFDEAPTQSGSDKNLIEMLSTPSAWMMLWTGTMLAGGGTVETNNLGQMVEALGYSKAVVPATLALFSVAQSGGRVITGAISESALTYNTNWCFIERGIPRPFFFVVASLAAVLSHTMLAVATEEIFFVYGVTLCGIAFGMIWPLMVLCVGEIYGTAHVGANYMFYDGVTSAAGTFLLSKMVAQKVYEEHIDTRSSEGNTTCIGQACFRETHFVIVGLSLTCIVTSIILQYKTRDVYEKRRY